VSDPRPRPVYLDHHATTPVDPRALEKMLPYFTSIFGNASSMDHHHGAEAQAAVEKARGQVARLIGADAKEIVFTSGATESINLALLGAAQQRVDRGKHIITSLIEHPAVLDTCRYLETRGWEITHLPVDPNGLHDPEQFKAALRPDTVLVSVMAANNEIGVIQPIREIAEIAHSAGALFHTDATQAVGYEALDVHQARIDLASFSAHKIYGPKGVGALYVRRSYPRVRIVQQLHGGGHERGLRSGTLNVPGIVGFGEAAAIASSVRSSESQRVRLLRDELLRGLQGLGVGVQVNGDLTRRLPNNLNVAFLAHEARSILALISDEVSVSLGSACASASVHPSHVIVALGDGEARSHSSIRFGLGRFNEHGDVQAAVTAIARAVHQLERLRP
jgi:cysteine desulfurase